MKFLLIALMYFFTTQSLASSSVTHSKKTSYGVAYKDTDEALALDKNAKHVKVFTVVDRIYEIDIGAGTYKIEAEILLK